MMTLSTRGRYAARIMAYLAREEVSDKATKLEISKAEDISPNYVEQIMIRLREAGLIVSHRGRNGGFSLARDPEKITLADVLHATDGRVLPAPCLDAHCSRLENCPTRPIWIEAAEAAEKVFRNTSIAQLAANTEEKILQEPT